jgi:beta-lactam-binding protein with PASTA domain
MTMIDQQPSPLSQVKKGRTIYLTVNSDKPPMVKLKDLSQSVERQAIKILENAGFSVNPDSKYEPDPAEGWVLRVEVNGKPVDWGTTLPKGTKLTLVLGDGSENADGLKAADYVGMDYHLCIAALKMHRRILGRVDSTELTGPLSLAKVYKQVPGAGEKIKPSDPISIWITDPETFRLLLPNPGDDEDDEL